MDSTHLTPRTRPSGHIDLGVGRPPPALAVVNFAVQEPPMRPCRVCNAPLDLAMPVHVCCVCRFHHCDGCGTEADRLATDAHTVAGEDAQPRELD